MLYFFRSLPSDVPDPPFKSGDVTIRIGKLAEENYHLLDFLGR